MLTKIFKYKTARESARANIGISKLLRIKDGDRSCDQHILQQTVDIVRQTADKPKLPHINLASSQTLGFTAAAAVRTTLSVNKTLKVRNGSIGSPRGKLVSAIIAIVLAAVFATAMSAHPNQPQFAGVYGWVAGGSAAPPLLEQHQGATRGPRVPTSTPARKYLAQRGPASSPEEEISFCSTLHSNSRSSP